MTDREADFRALYDQHFTALLGYALRRSDSGEDAADVVAETFVVAWRRMSELPPGDQARLWLYGVARRVLANGRRGAVRRDRLGSRLRQRMAVVAPDHADAVVGALDVREALAGLREADRELLLLTSWEGLGPQEVAVVLGIGAGTVRTRLSRARERLRRQLGDDRTVGGHVHGDRPSLVPEEDR